MVLIPVTWDLPLGEQLEAYSENTKIDAVVRTGGSAQIPSFVRMIERIFGPEKVVAPDVFTRVTSGLAIRANTEDRR